MTYAIISSPLQIINTQEYRYRYDITNIKYIYIHNRLYSNKTSIEYINNTFRYYNIPYSTIHTHYDVYNILLLFILIIYIRNKPIIIGDINNSFMYTLIHCINSYTVIVEDGASTFSKPKDILSRSYSFIKWFKVNNNIHKYNIINNNDVYKHIKINKIQSNEIHFFGSKTMPLKKMDEVEEISYLNKVYSYISARHRGEIVYHPHRMDNYKKKEKIKNIGFKISELRLPAELIYIDGMRPSAIYTTVTSVAFTLTKIGLKTTVLIDSNLKKNVGDEYSILHVINLDTLT